MAKTTGSFGGFAFDPEVFSDYMSEQPTWRNEIIASGIVQTDPTIMGLIGDKGNVATLPFYTPLDVEDYVPLNNDGATDNTPTTITGGKQTAMLIQRMKAFKAQDFTKELTGADPMGHIAGQVSNYYAQVWQRELMNIAKAVMSVTALKSHVTDITSASTTIEDANKVSATSLLYAQQAALGDSTEGYGLIVMHSKIYAAYQALDLVEYSKYTNANGLRNEVELPTIGGKIVLVNDRYTSETSTATATKDNVVYSTYMFGQGAFLSATKSNYENPYYTDYDPETTAGVEKLYTKQGRVLHPNGLSFAAENTATDSPTYDELGKSANWSLKFNAKNVRIGVLKSNG